MGEVGQREGGVYAMLSPSRSCFAKSKLKNNTNYLRERGGGKTER